MRSITVAVFLFFFSSLAQAEFEPWKDYQPSEEVYSVTTIKVKSNMEDVYLGGIAKTWVTGNEVAIKLGHIKGYKIFRSDLPASGDFNLMLIIEFAKTSDLAPNKAKYAAFMKEFTKKKSDETTEFAQKNYPAMREITGEYFFREIKLK